MSNTQLLYTQWNTDGNGNTISVPIQNEIHQVVNGQMLLNQIPDEISKVTITGMNEIKKNQDITASNQYKVDYNTGIVSFHSSKEGGTLAIAQYYGRGIIFIDASRIATQSSGSTVLQTLKDLVVSNSQAIIDEATRTTNENNRKTSETSRVNAETTRVSNDIARGNAESIRVTNETARQTAETARVTAEGLRVSSETARVTAETARSSAETARVTAETARATSFVSIKAAYDAAVASQSNVEVTTARLDGNSNITYPDLASRLNATDLAPMIRETIPSGFTKIGTLDYTYMSTNQNSIKFADEWVAFVNGFKAVIPAGTIVTLDSPPEKDVREDFVFLEVWLDQTTGASKNRLRTVAGVDFTVNPEGLANVFGSVPNSLVFAQGGNTSPLNTASDYDRFRKASNPSWLYFNSDSGLYVSGDGSSTKKTLFKTLDGYVYAIPLFRIPRRPSCGYMDTGEYDKISPLTLGNLQQRILNKDRVAHSGDGGVGVKIEGRTLVNLLGTDGDCEDLSKWINSGMTLDTLIKLFGNSSFKCANAGNNVGKNILCDQTHKYFVSVHAYISSYTSGNSTIFTCDYGTVANQSNMYLDNTKVNQWQRKSLIITGKANGGFYLQIGGSGVTVVNYDGISVYDLTAIYGAGQEPSDIALLERELPFVSGVGSASPVSIKSVGKNLILPSSSYMSANSASATMINNGIKVKGNGTTTSSYIFYILKLKPSTNYTLSATIAQILGTTCKMAVYNGSRTVALNNTTPGSTGYKTVTFATLNDGLVSVIFYPNSALTEIGEVDFTNIQLEEGSVATTYEPYQESGVILPSECNDMKSIGSTVKDYTDLYARKHVKKVSDMVVLDGNFGWASATASQIGYKRLYSNVLFPLMEQSTLTIKFDGSSIPGTDTLANLSLLQNSNKVAYDGRIYLSAPNSDTGFTDGVIPTANEIKSYFYGWKMCHSDGVSPYVPSLVPYTPATWAEWSVTSGGTITRDSSGMLVSVGVGEWGKIYIPTSIKPSTKYGILYNLISADIVQNLALGGDTFTYENIPKVIGNNKFVATSKASITLNNFAIQLYTASTAIGSYKIKDVRIFELPTGSQIETDFTNMTADQLSAKYLFYGLNPKNWKKVTDGTGLTATLPTASYAGYTPYKMFYQLAIPIETDISDLIKGRLYANNGATNFIVDNMMTSVKAPYGVNSLVTNGDFSNGTTGWTGGGSTYTATNNIMTSTGNGTGAYNSIISTLSVKAINTHKYYARCMAKITDAVCLGTSLLLDTVSAAQVTVKSISTPAQNINNIYSGVITWSNNYENEYLRLKITATYADAATANGKVMEIQRVYAIDLTAIFGAGNEPDQAWCDKYLDFGTNYLVTGDVNTTALVLQRDNSDVFYGVNKQFAVVPASKYKTGKYELMYKPADGTVLIPDTTVTVGAQTLSMKNNTSVGNLILADSDVGYKKNLDGSISLLYELFTLSPQLAPNEVRQLTVSANFYSKCHVGDYITNLSSTSKNILILSKDGSNKITVRCLAAVNMGTDNYKLLPRSIDSIYSDIIVQNDITQLSHQVSLTGFDNKQILNKEFDILCRGEFTSY